LSLLEDFLWAEELEEDLCLEELELEVCRSLERSLSLWDDFRLSFSSLSLWDDFRLSFSSLPLFFSRSLSLLFSLSRSLTLVLSLSLLDLCSFLWLSLTLFGCSACSSCCEATATATRSQHPDVAHGQQTRPVVIEKYKVSPQSD